MSGHWRKLRARRAGRTAAERVWPHEYTPLSFSAFGAPAAPTVHALSALAGEMAFARRASGFRIFKGEVMRELMEGLSMAIVTQSAEACSWRPVREHVAGRPELATGNRSW
jgi:hypothetical protein